MTRFAWMCSHESYQPEVLLRHAQLAEEAGFDAVVASDVFHPWVDDVGAAGFVWSWLGAVAVRTSRIELVTTVTAPMLRYHPAVIAQAGATVARLSHGRLVLGVGVGDPIHHLPLGFPVASYGERIGRLREAVELIRRLWSGETVSHRGRFFDLDRARLYSPPPAPPRIWMGAAGPRSARLAAELADGVITSVKDPDRSLREVIEPFRTALAARVGDAAGGSVMGTRWCILAKSDRDAWAALGPMRGLHVPGRDAEGDPAVLRERADRMDREEILGRFERARDASDLVAAYEPLVGRLSADYVSIQVATGAPEETIGLVGAEVLPALRRSVPDHSIRNSSQ